MAGFFWTSQSPAIAHAVRDALAKAGVHRPEELESIVARLIEAGGSYINTETDDPVSEHVAFVLTHLPENTPDERLRELTRRRVSDYIERSKRAQAEDNLSKSETRFLAWLTAAP